MTKAELKKYAQELEKKLETAHGAKGWQILKELQRVRQSIAAF